MFVCQGYGWVGYFTFLFFLISLSYSATDYKIPKLTFVFIEFLRQYDVYYWYVLYIKMILNYQ